MEKFGFDKAEHEPSKVVFSIFLTPGCGSTARIYEIPELSRPAERVHPSARGLHWTQCTAAFEAEYDLLLTQRLILQPRIETGFAFQDARETAPH